MPETPPAIQVEHLSHAFGGTRALEDVSLSVPAGASFALLGPNGAGKTTLLNILCTLLRPDSGTALVAGADVAREPLRARRGIGVVFQDSSLDDRLTAAENLDFHGLAHGMARRVRHAAMAEVLALVELTDWQETVVRNFSGGMRRRLEIARALMHHPRILFLDEPTVGLDAQTRVRIWRYLDGLRRERGLTVLTTTHYIEEVESADLVCIIDNGRILAEGSPESLKVGYGQRWLRVIAREAETASAIRRAYPAAMEVAPLHLAIPAPDAATVEAFLAAFGNRLTEVRFEEPTLESVFLSLTGRELRDRGEGAHAAEREAGRKGGRR